ncbi:MAG TPA: hypothetical protein VIY72_06205 [Acidimicrobiales bacterium]
MPMREECKQFESRTYRNGETVRKCNLDLAPEAPWKCPDDCASYERRLADVNWQHGALVTPPTPPEPKGESIAELLDAAEDIVNAAGPEILAEVQAEQAKQARKDAGALGRLKRRFGRKR